MFLTHKSTLPSHFTPGAPKPSRTGSCGPSCSLCSCHCSVLWCVRLRPRSPALVLVRFSISLRPRPNVPRGLCTLFRMPKLSSSFCISRLRLPQVHILVAWRFPLGPTFSMLDWCGRRGLLLAPLYFSSHMPSGIQNRPYIVDLKVDVVCQTFLALYSKESREGFFDRATMIRRILHILCRCGVVILCRPVW